jgi:hypothetical protein
MTKYQRCSGPSDQRYEQAAAQLTAALTVYVHDTKKDRGRRPPRWVYVSVTNTPVPSLGTITYFILLLGSVSA